MPSLNRNENVTCATRVTKTTKPLLAHVKKSLSARTSTCPTCTNFSTKSRAKNNRYNVNKHSKAFTSIVHICKIREKIFNSFYLLRKRKRNEHGAQRGSSAQTVYDTQLIGDVDYDSLKEELETCIHFLVDIELENGIGRVCNFVMDILRLTKLLENLNVFLTVSIVQLI